jgi:hypothetical protein
LRCYLNRYSAGKYTARNIQIFTLSQFSASTSIGF